ncbi:unnamed protein product [Lactuca virosa]|uniref:4Fe-4S ferredoxin-type domain-containing protein n=1 Tax=Lactuca virosa TaxID=75947 RepID=A0AAU9M6Q7_9ASTR|nr:unnamed protein product [Lactuca virosa]
MPPDDDDNDHRLGGVAPTSIFMRPFSTYTAISLLQPSGIPRLGISTYEWWSEALHDISRHRKGVRFNGTITACTKFPQVILIAASFDSHLWYRIVEIDLLNVSFDGELPPDRISVMAGVKELRKIAPLRRWNLVEIDAKLSKLTMETKRKLVKTTPAKETLQTGPVKISLKNCLACSGCTLPLQMSNVMAIGGADKSSS